LYVYFYRLYDDIVNIKSPQTKTSRPNEIKSEFKENEQIQPSNQKLRDSVKRINELMENFYVN